MMVGRTSGQHRSTAMRMTWPCLAMLGMGTLMMPGVALSQSPSGQTNPSTQRFDGTSDVTETAKTLKLGEEAYETGKFQQAYEFFLKAWGQRKTYDVASYLGTSELRLNRFRDAAEHLSYALHLLPPTTPLGPERMIREKLAEVLPHVAALRIRTNVAGTSLKVDGRPMDQPPYPRGEVFVDPGIRTVELSARGYEPATRTFEVGKGDIRELTLYLSVPPAPVPSSPLPSSTVTAPPSGKTPPSEVSSHRGAGGGERSTYLPAYITGSVAVVGVAAGVVFAALSSRTDADASVRRTAILAVASGENPCVQPSSTVSEACGYLQTTLDDRNRFHNLAVASLIGAGAATIATGYFISRPLKTRVGAAPVLTTHTGGLTVVGEW